MEILLASIEREERMARSATGAARVIDVVESAYQAEGDERAWLRGIAESLRPLVDHGAGMAAFTYGPDESTGFRMTEPIILAGGAAWQEHVPRMHAMMPPALAARLYGPGAPPLGLVSQQVDPAAAGSGVIEMMASAFSQVGIVDAIGVISCDPSGHGCCVTAGLPERRVPARSTRALFGRVTTHIAAGLRLVRKAAGEPEAILDPGGRVLHAEEPAKAASARAVLRDAAKSIDRARGRLRREDPGEALEIWQGLVDGRWSLVDRFESDGRRYLVARRNDPELRDPRALTPRERQVVGYAALGHSNKLIAYSLGLSTSSVGTHLASAMRKIGVRSRPALVALLTAVGS